MCLHSSQILAATAAVGSIRSARPPVLCKEQAIPIHVEVEGIDAVLRGAPEVVVH